MFKGNKLISNIPRGPARPTKLNADSIEDYPQIRFDEDHDFNLKVSYVYEYESAIHNNGIKKCIVNGLHSGISDDSIMFIGILLFYLTGKTEVAMYETRKLLCYDKSDEAGGI